MYGPRPVDILLVTSEVAPYNQHTSIAQGVASLAKALRGLHHKVTVISPLYAGIDPNARSLARRLSKVEVVVGEHRAQCELYDGRTTGGVDLIFIGEAKLFAGRANVLDTKDPADTLAAAIFSRAAAEVARARDPQPDVVHAFGAGAALVLAYTQATLPAAHRLLQVSDLTSVGALGATTVEMFGLSPDTMADPAFASAKNLLALGAAAAERVVLHSATRASQWTTDASVLEGQLARAPEKLLVLPEGVDAALWNPLTDASLDARFDPMNLTGKRHCKAQWQREHQLPEREDVPLIVALGSLGPLDRLTQLASDLVNNDLQLAVVMGPDAGDPSVLSKFQERFPDRVAVLGDANAAAIHRALGAADVLLLPVLAEPTEPLHRCAHRYGALPVVAAVGSVQDTVVDCDPELVTGNAFLFHDDATLLATVQRAVAAYAKGSAFEKLRQRVMRLDTSWDRTARLYEQAVQSRKLTN